MKKSTTTNEETKSNFTSRATLVALGYQLKNEKSPSTNRRAL